MIESICSGRRAHNQHRLHGPECSAPESSTVVDLTRWLLSRCSPPTSRGSRDISCCESADYTWSVSPTIPRLRPLRMGDRLAGRPPQPAAGGAGALGRAHPAAVGGAARRRGDVRPGADAEWRGRWRASPGRSRRNPKKKALFLGEKGLESWRARQDSNQPSGFSQEHQNGP